MFHRKVTSLYLTGLLLLTGMGVMALAGCGGAPESAQEKPVSASSTLQTGEGLVLEGEGPFPATLLARSENTLSNEENQRVLQEISQELDKIIDTTGNLEVIDDAAISAQDQEPIIQKGKEGTE